MAKDTKTRSAAGILILIVVGILIVINLISLNIFSRADLTDNNIYSLSEASKDLMRNLNDRLNVKVFFTDDLPAPHNGDARYLKDMLDDYKAYSGGYLHYEFIDPAKENKEQEVQGYRIPPLQFNVFRNDKTEFIKGYKGLVLLYGDKQEVIPFIENTNNLEYEISGSIKKLISSKMPSVAFTIGHREPNMSEGLQWAYQLLQREYMVQFLDLNTQKEIAGDIDVLIVASPKSAFTDWEIYLIDQYIMRGGRVAFLLDRFEVDIAQARVTPINSGLDSLLKHYGVGLQENLVVDMQCNLVPVMRTFGQYQMQSIVKYPFYLAITNFNEEIPVVKDFKSLGLIYASPLDLSVPVGSGTEREVLFASSKQSGMIGRPFNIAPEREFVTADFSMSNLPLAAVITGKIRSYFADKAKPNYPGDDTGSVSMAPMALDSTSDARIIVVGNGSFITDDFRRNESGFALLLNIADWLSQDKGLISIRSKEVGMRVLEETSDGAKKVIKYVNILAMPIVVILFGIIRWQIRRSLRRRESL